MRLRQKGGLAITADKHSSTVNNLETVVQERSQIIENYIRSTENTLTAFSRAGEAISAMRNPEDPDVFAAAQAYTETFSADVANLEGLYISEWNSHVLTHTNPRGKCDG